MRQLSAYGGSFDISIRGSKDIERQPPFDGM
jgi:hypothetical protein